MQTMESLLRKDYIFEDLQADNQDELFEIMGGKLTAAGITKDTYVQALKDREEKFPTGLPTAGITIAMPHTDSDHVNEGCISIARLKKPIVFHEMGNAKKELKVEMVFMLALNDPTTHLEMLQKIIGMFSNKEILNKLKKAKKSEEIYDIVTQITLA